MGKIICFSLCFLFLISCGEKKQENSTGQAEDTVIIDVDTVGIPEYGEEPAYAAEIFEYRSESLKDYQLYAIYSFEDAPHLIAVKNDEARLLKFDETRTIENGQALEDEEFTATSFLEETEKEGIHVFEQIELTTREKGNIVFNHSQTKRSLEIGTQYEYSTNAGSGNFALAPQDDYSIFSVETNAGEHFCELEGKTRIKGNLAYYTGKLYAENCKLIFFFTNKKVQILQVSSNSDCGCGANASLNATFTSR